MRGAPQAAEAALPAWAEAVADRLRFFARRRRGHRATTRALAITLAALRRRLAEPDGAEAALQRFLAECLALVEAAPGSAAIRDEMHILCGLARTALQGDADDRPLLAQERAIEDRLPADTLCAIRVPGRTVFLAAMVAKVPEEQGAAAVMLVNDLAAVGSDLPGRALQAAAGLR